MKSMHPGLARVLGLLLLTACAPGALACSACYGQSDSELAQGMNWGIFTLLGVIGLVLSGVTTAFVLVSRRSVPSDGAQPPRAES